ncbi:multidrug efflux SMR transporter [Burkholderia pyrrocinia]|uniref:DMT family transporter n=1 Tax=Burkholderia sp. IT-111MI5 TaxID=3026439 RepID=UPI002A2B9208|nr:multidrug efflux SMR transporter [Burkholderia pyrrocinia]EKS9895573.1 multidrug efflux SMR transporter [Burkholderia pyrrocinia]
MFVVSSPLAAWSIVVASGLLEVVFSVTMKLSESYTKVLPGGISIVAAVLSVWLMSLTLTVLPLGDAYAVWAGIGAAGTALVGVVWFHEPAFVGRLICIALVVVGIVGLQLQEGV